MKILTLTLSCTCILLFQLNFIFIILFIDFDCVGSSLLCRLSLVGVSRGYSLDAMHTLAVAPLAVAPLWALGGRAQ